MRSPCIGCDLERQDKSNSVCQSCSKRIAYADSVAKGDSSLPSSSVSPAERAVVNSIPPIRTHEIQKPAAVGSGTTRGPAPGRKLFPATKQKRWGEKEDQFALDHKDWSAQRMARELGFSQPTASVAIKRLKRMGTWYKVQPPKEDPEAVRERLIQTSQEENARLCDRVLSKAIAKQEAPVDTKELQFAKHRLVLLVDEAGDGVYEELERMAEQEMRTIEAQALYLIRSGIELALSRRAQQAISLARQGVHA